MNAFVRTFSYTICAAMFSAFVFVLLQVMPRGGAGKANRVEGDFAAITSAIRAHRVATGSYPSTENGLAHLVIRTGEGSSRTPFNCALPDPWGSEYGYRRLAADDPRHFEIYSLGPDGVPSEDDLSSLDER